MKTTRETYVKPLLLFSSALFSVLKMTMVALFVLNVIFGVQLRDGFPLSEYQMLALALVGMIFEIVFKIMYLECKN
ncbi:hypothetical protein Q4574_11085 [Aliiglaciecola sp. 3_MG-2023]|uniref:hypothetical protein n=1 Tax=Aliiglaciecola sp. 3_MG-2023 TaxID=3062644 RepID=UPI0026E1AB7E|nr:hypothetical protein [Aliiglaciecola sp. 3_MG-2023]MDO6693833.1 hypothetical protein [Aliiglaciecola sp. 3_MG-2023]